MLKENTDMGLRERVYKRLGFGTLIVLGLLILPSCKPKPEEPEPPAGRATRPGGRDSFT